MGTVRTKTIKKSAKTIIEKYYTKLTFDFHTNKRIIDDIAVIQTKRMRNKIAGYTTHLMKRIQKGPVKGISLKLQEEEKEKKMNTRPDVSAIQTDNIQVDALVANMLQEIGLENLEGVNHREEEEEQN